MTPARICLDSDAQTVNVKDLQDRLDILALRRFLKVTHHHVRRVQNLLNNRPRACLGYKTPNEVFFVDSAL